MIDYILVCLCKNSEYSENQMSCNGGEMPVLWEDTGMSKRTEVSVERC